MPVLTVLNSSLTIIVLQLIPTSADKKAADMNSGEKRQTGFAHKNFGSMQMYSDISGISGIYFVNCIKQDKSGKPVVKMDF